MAPVSGLSHLSNPIASPEQLANTASQLDGVPANLEESIRYASQRLMQAAGISLRLPQDIIAQAIVIFTRFWLGPDGGSLLQFDSKVVSFIYCSLIASDTSSRKSQQLRSISCASPALTL